MPIFWCGLQLGSRGWRMCGTVISPSPPSKWPNDRSFVEVWEIFVARPFLYHVFDDPAFNGRAVLAPASIPVIPPGGGAKIPRQMYSLKRDMAELRRVGAG